MNICSAIFFTCGLTASAVAQSAGDKLIPNDKLKWEYYSINADSSAKYWANTLWIVYYKYKVVAVHTDTVKVELKLSHFLQGDSWVRPDKESEQLLNHEQVHFNTALLCEAEFKNSIDTTVLLLSNYQSKIDSVFNAVLNKMKELNVQYDKETNHMWNKKAQHHWEKKMHELIEAANMHRRDSLNAL